MTINREKVLSNRLENVLAKDININLMKSYLRIDFDDDDDDRMLIMMLGAGKSLAKSYLRYSEEEWQNTPNEITIAVLAIVEHWYKNRGILTEDITKQELPFVFSGILDIHRNWEVI